jgi:ATP-binding cassette subfamily F protein uup
LSYKDQRELTELPQKIESLETNIKDISLKMSAPEFYQSERTLIEKTEQQLAAYQTELSDYYQRWELLEQ